MNGTHVKDPMGWRNTIAFKDAKMSSRSSYVASHGYTKSNEGFALVKATHTREKGDNTKKSSGRVVWPAEGDLEEYVPAKGTEEEKSRQTEKTKE